MSRSGAMAREAQRQRVALMAALACALLISDREVVTIDRPGEDLPAVKMACEDVSDRQLCRGCELCFHRQSCSRHGWNGSLGLQPGGLHHCSWWWTLRCTALPCLACQEPSETSFSVACPSFGPRPMTRPCFAACRRPCRALRLHRGLCISTLAFFGLRRLAFLRAEGEVVFWTDTVGLAAFAVLGARIAARLPGCHVHAGACALCGLSTACFGGLVRDILCRGLKASSCKRHEVVEVRSRHGSSMQSMRCMPHLPCSGLWSVWGSCVSVMPLSLGTAQRHNFTWFHWTRSWLDNSTGLGSAIGRRGHALRCLGGHRTSSIGTEPRITSTCLPTSGKGTTRRSLGARPSEPHDGAVKDIVLEALPRRNSLGMATSQGLGAQSLFAWYCRLRGAAPTGRRTAATATSSSPTSRRSPWRRLPWRRCTVAGWRMARRWR